MCISALGRRNSRTEPCEAYAASGEKEEFQRLSLTICVDFEWTLETAFAAVLLGMVDVVDPHVRVIGTSSRELVLEIP